MSESLDALIAGLAERKERIEYAAMALAVARECLLAVNVNDRPQLVDEVRQLLADLRPKAGVRKPPVLKVAPALAVRLRQFFVARGNEPADAKAIFQAIGGKREQLYAVLGNRLTGQPRMEIVSPGVRCHVRALYRLHPDELPPAVGSPPRPDDGGTLPECPTHVGLDLLQPD